MRALLRSAVAAAVALGVLLAGVGARDVVTRIVFPDQAITFDPLRLLVGRLEASYVPTVIKSVQRGTITLATVVTNTATITSVNTSNSLLHWLGNTSNNTGTFSSVRNVNLVFTNATTITAQVGNGANTQVVSFEVTEYRPGVLKSVNRGVIALAAASGTATITAVNTAKAMTEYLGHFDAGNNTEDITNPKVVLTNATTVTVNTIAASGISVSWQVAEYN